MVLVGEEFFIAGTAGFALAPNSPSVWAASPRTNGSSLLEPVEQHRHHQLGVPGDLVDGVGRVDADPVVGVFSSSFATRAGRSRPGTWPGRGPRPRGPPGACRRGPRPVPEPPVSVAPTLPSDFGPPCPRTPSSASLEHSRRLLRHFRGRADRTEGGGGVETHLGFLVLQYRDQGRDGRLRRRPDLPSPAAAEAGTGASLSLSSGTRSVAAVGVIPEPAEGERGFRPHLRHGVLRSFPRFPGSPPSRPYRGTPALARSPRGRRRQCLSGRRPDRERLPPVDVPSLHRSEITWAAFRQGISVPVSSGRPPASTRRRPAGRPPVRSRRLQREPVTHTQRIS